MKHARQLGIRTLLLLLMLSLTAAPATLRSAPTSLHAQSTQPKVLYINSYHLGYKWSDDILKGIESVLGSAGENVDLRVEHMDTKRTTNEQYLLALRDTYRIKYAGTKLDLVIVSDDVGVNFLLQYADVMFPNTPIVFCGANYFDQRRLADQKLVTGVSEEADLQGTLDIALKLHPKTTNVVVIIDTTVTGRQIHQGMVEIMPQYPQITFTLLESVKMDDVRQQVSQLRPTSLVLVTNFFRDGADVFYEFNEFSSLIAQSSAVPVYAGWDYSLGYGVVGGKLISGFTEGQRAAELAQRILRGEKPADIPVVKQVKSRYMFDYPQLSKWGIKTSALPQGSVIINQPFSFYETYKTQIWVVGISFLVLVTIAMSLFVNVLSRRRAEARLAESNRELQTIRLSLEQRVELRTAELAQRATQLQAAAEVARATTSVLDLDTLLGQVVDLVRERFELYYVGLFLPDQGEQFAVLRAGTGRAGQTMMAQGHKLPIGGGSMIGQCITTGQARIALDVGHAERAVRFDNPLLPNTHSEMALPLRSRGLVIGAITVQSARPNAFSETDIAIMQTMADQVAVAIDNARLFAQAQTTLQELEATQQRYLAQAWAEYMRGRAVSGYEQAGGDLTPLERLLPEAQQAIAERRPVVGNGNGETQLQNLPPGLVMPIVLRDQPIGALGLRDAEPGRRWSGDDIALAQAIGEQFALAAENLRLFEETQHRAAREELTGTITARMRETLDLDTVLRTAVDEMYHVLGLDEIAIRMITEETTNQDTPEAKEVTDYTISGTGAHGAGNLDGR